MTPPKLVLFDCDGVLVDSEVISVQVMIDNLETHGLSLTLNHAMEIFVGGTMAENGELAKSMGADIGPDWQTEIKDEIFEALSAGTPVIAGIPELLDRLDAAGIPFCVGSNGREAKMEITLGQNGLWDRFKDHCFSAYTLGVAKPDPALYLTAAKSFGIDPKDCVVVEDSTAGVRAAVAAGMRCLGYAPEGGTVLADFGAELFSDMAEVPDLIGLPKV